MAIALADIKKLRDMTSAGMMDCKKALEIRGGSHEVGFAAQAHEDGLSAVYTAENGTLGGLVVTTLGKSGFTFFTKDFNSTLEVSSSLFEGLLAVHHTGAGHITQLLDIS